MTGVAGSLLAGSLVLLLGDSLCPEHRMWIQGLAGLAVVGAVASSIALIRRRATAAYWAVIPAVCGIAIGVIDARHDPGRGQLIVVVFTAITIVAVLIALRTASVSRWAREAEEQMIVSDAVPSTPTARPAAPASTARTAAPVESVASVEPQVTKLPVER
ncbi:MAG TPA: hypothetical protein VJM33_06575 [Microthrixaceae bacterium]|nr:hypothetical protein [Microthrixaceae bacterium]